jgi:DNA-binding LytR/AlgR family response regulator
MTRLTFFGHTQNSDSHQFSLAPDEIVYVDAYKGKSRIFLSSKSPVIANENLDSTEMKLSKFQFLRISPATIINLEHINDISFGNETIVSLSNNCRFVVDKNIAILMKKYLHY